MGQKKKNKKKKKKKKNDVDGKLVMDTRGGQQTLTSFSHLFGLPFWPPFDSSTSRPG
jgi:hypothetical protein